MARPISGTFHPIYQQRYIDATKANSIKELIAAHSDDIINFVNNIPSDKALHSYAADKWTVNQVLQHIIDTERIFAFRALCISRGERQSLPGFDENEYANIANASHRNIEAIKEEFSLVRKSTDALLLSFTDEQLLREGITNNYTISVNALAFIIFGHSLHHISVLKEQYL